MRHEDITRSTRARGHVRTLRQQEELPQLRDHLLRLDPQSRHDRFHGFMDDDFIERYAAKCADDGTVIIAYIEDGVVRGAAELHPPGQSPDSQAEIAFSVETCVRRQGVGSILFRRLIAEARSKGYLSLRITTGAQNQAMRALANKFGAHLTFRHGESTGSIDLDERFHENDPMGFDPTFVIPGCVPAGDSRSERRPGIHSPCGGYGFRARLSRASRVTRAPE